MNKMELQLRLVTWRKVGSSHGCGVDPGVEGIAGNPQVGLVELVRLGPAERTVAKTLLKQKRRTFAQMNFFTIETNSRDAPFSILPVPKATRAHSRAKTHLDDSMEPG